MDNDTVVELELTEDEAQFLADVMGLVSGYPYTSRRKYQLKISNALSSVGFEFSDETDFRGGIYFLTSDGD